MQTWILPSPLLLQKKLKRRSKGKPLLLPNKSQAPFLVMVIWLTQLVFPLKSTPYVTAGLPEAYLSICSPETLSQYHCQYPSCSLEFAQKAAACNHICFDHLSVALPCLYCSFEHNPKMHWYSASAQECHSLTHSKENLHIHPNDPSFAQQFFKTEAIPSTSGST